MYRKNKNITLIGLIFVVLFSGLVLIGCSQTEAGDSEEEMIEKVLALQFNGPDEEFIDLMWNPEYREIVDGVEVNEELDAYVQETYGEYFTENALDTFIRTYGMQYPHIADSNDYTLNLRDVTIEASENASNRYTFTAQVGYQKADGEEEIATVDGTVLFSTEEEKIGKFDYGSDMDLLEAIGQ